MSEPRFELILHSLETEIATDIHKLSHALSKLFDEEPKYIEIQLVKVKLSPGRKETIKMDLTKNKAEHYQKVLKVLGMNTTLNAELALVPIKKTVLKDDFTCPACNTQQSVKKDAIQICARCGIVKENYLRIQKYKKQEAERIKQIKLIEAQEKFKPRRSIEQQNEEFLTKKLNKLNVKKKKNVAILLSIAFGVVAMGGSSYIYFNSNNNKAEITSTQEESSEKSNSIASPDNMPLNLKNMATADLSDEAMIEKLENPYAKFADPSKSKIPMEQGINQINTILAKNGKHLPKVDKGTLKDISSLYKESEKSQKKIPDYSLIKNIANSLSDETIKNDVIRQASWGEVVDGVKSFSEFGVYSTARKGEDARAIKLAQTLIDIYIKELNYQQAEELATQISDPYLQAVALTKIMDTQFQVNKEGAKLQRDKIKTISELESLTLIQKPLIFGILARAERLFKGEASAEPIFNIVQISVNNIKDDKEKIATLLRLSEDQREGLNLKYAHFFLETAYAQLAKAKLQVVQQDKLYELLAEHFAKIFDFTRSKELMAKITDSEKKTNLALKVQLIEKQAFL